MRKTEKACRLLKNHQELFKLRINERGYVNRRTLDGCLPHTPEEWHFLLNNELINSWESIEDYGECFYDLVWGLDTWENSNATARVYEISEKGHMLLLGINVLD